MLQNLRKYSGGSSNKTSTSINSLKNESKNSLNNLRSNQDSIAFHDIYEHKIENDSKLSVKKKFFNNNYHDSFFDSVDLGSIKQTLSRGSSSDSNSGTNLTINTTNSSNNIHTTSTNDITPTQTLSECNCLPLDSNNNDSFYMFGEKLDVCITDEEGSDGINDCNCIENDLSTLKMKDIFGLKTKDPKTKGNKSDNGHSQNHKQSNSIKKTKKIAVNKMGDPKEFNYHSFIQDITNDKSTELLRYLEPCNGVYPPTFDEVNANKLVRYPIYENIQPCIQSDLPPAYEPTIDHLTIVSVKFEWTSPYNKIEIPVWRNFILELNSTQLNFYEIDKSLTDKISNYTNNLPDPESLTENSLKKTISAPVSSKQGYLKFGGIFSASPKKTYVFNKFDRESIISNVSKHKPRYLSYENLFKSFSLQCGKIGLPVDYPHMYNGLRLRLEGEQLLLNFSCIDDLIDWITYIQIGISVSLDLDLRPFPDYRIVPRRSRYENIQTDNTSRSFTSDTSLNSNNHTEGGSVSSRSSTFRTQRSTSVSTVGSLLSHNDTTSGYNGRKCSNLSGRPEHSTAIHQVNTSKGRSNSNTKNSLLAVNYSEYPTTLSATSTKNGSSEKNASVPKSIITVPSYTSVANQSRRSSEENKMNKNNNIGSKLKTLFKTHSEDQHTSTVDFDNNSTNYNNKVHIKVSDYSSNGPIQFPVKNINLSNRRYSNAIDPMVPDWQELNGYGMNPLFTKSVSNESAYARNFGIHLPEDYITSDASENNDRFTEMVTSNSTFSEVSHCISNTSNSYNWRNRSCSTTSQDTISSTTTQPSNSFRHPFTSSNNTNPNHPTTGTNTHNNSIHSNSVSSESNPLNLEGTMSSQNSLFSYDGSFDLFTRTRSHSITSNLSFLQQADGDNNSDKKWRPQELYCSRRKYIRDTLRCIKPLTDETRWIGKAICRSIKTPIHQKKFIEINYGHPTENKTSNNEEMTIKNIEKGDSIYDDNNCNIKNHFLQLLIVGRFNYKTDVDLLYAASSSDL